VSSNNLALNELALKELIVQADQILSSGQAPDIVNHLEKYADSFSEWYGAYQKSLEQNKPLNTKEELEMLLTRHEKVMELSESLKESIPDEMAKLKNKGKGIMAYTDTLPKKISFTKPRKG
jgi:hypothetical protein